MKFIDYGKQTIDTNDIKSVNSTLRSNWITQGPKIAEFEEKIASYCGANYAVVVNSGTSALHLSYLAAGIGEGDEVITTPNTFVATTNMLLICGAKPVFCDIRMDTYNIDEEQIEKHITRKTKAIVVVHFTGHPCEMDAIHNIAKIYNLIVIEDAAHALGSQYQGSLIGSLNSDFTTFSFHPVKPITTGEGGAIVTNNRSKYEELKLIRSHGVSKNEDGLNVMTKLGYNYRLTDIQAALGITQLKKIDHFLLKRKRLVSLYNQKFDKVKNIICPVEKENVKSGWHLYVIRVDPETRTPLMKFLQKKGIGANVHYPAVYQHPYYKQHGYENGSFPNEEIYWKSCLTLPLHPRMEKKDVNYIINTVKSYFGKKN